MPFATPGLADIRKEARDFLAARLGAGALIPNSRARAFADGNAGLAHLTLLYLDWIAKQMLPDTAEAEFLRERHAQIWLGGWKRATFASGTVLATGSSGKSIPASSRITGPVAYETSRLVILGDGPTSVPIHALEPGALGNLDNGALLAFAASIEGVDATLTVDALSGGGDEESDEDLRVRVLDRIRKPPMGGDADDYVAWAEEFPGVTRAWCSPLEMGVGTVTIRFMMDDLRATDAGFPNSDDIDALAAYLDTRRPVTVKDMYVSAPEASPINFTITNLVPDTTEIRASINLSVAAMLKDKAAPAYAVNGVAVPAQTIFHVWIAQAVMETAGVESFDMSASDFTMSNASRMAVPGTITFA